MALAMPSRFSVLKIEDDDFHPANPNKNKDKKKSDQKQPLKKSEKSASAGAVKKCAKQQPAKSQSQQKKDKKKKTGSDQWEQWKRKDNEIVDGTFEEDLHTAILQSKLDYEANKDMYKQFKKEAEQQKKTNEVPNSKKKKNKAMSLEQFKNMVSNNQESLKKIDEDVDDTLNSSEDNQFFERIRSETKDELHKEFNKKSNKEDLKDTKREKVLKSFNNDTITISHLQEKLDSLVLENIALKTELEKSKKEILSVKNRNKTLCGMLASGEMRDKADILMDLEKHIRIKDELTEEVTRLNCLLEQERSRSKTGISATESHSSHNNKHNKEHKEKHRRKGKE